MSFITTTTTAICFIVIVIHHFLINIIQRYVAWFSPQETIDLPDEFHDIVHKLWLCMCDSLLLGSTVRAKSPNVTEGRNRTRGNRHRVKCVSTGIDHVLRYTQFFLITKPTCFSKWNSLSYSITYFLYYDFTFTFLSWKHVFLFLLKFFILTNYLTK